MEFYCLCNSCSTFLKPKKPVKLATKLWVLLLAKTIKIRQAKFETRNFRTKRNKSAETFRLVKTWKNQAFNPIDF